MLYWDTSLDTTSAAAVASGRAPNMPSREVLWPTTGPSGSCVLRSQLMRGVWRWRAVQLLAAERHNAWKGGAYNALSQAGIGCAYNIVSEFSLDILQEFGIKMHVKATE
jgi:hypothetical protein